MTNYLKDIIINDALVNSGFRHVRLLHDHAPSHTSDACEVLEDYRLAASTILKIISKSGVYFEEI